MPKRQPRSVENHRAHTRIFARTSSRAQKREAAPLAGLSPLLLREVGALLDPGPPESPDQPAADAVGAFDLDIAAAGRGSRPNTAKARITSPAPVSSSATPTTTPKTDSCSAM